MTLLKFVSLESLWVKESGEATYRRFPPHLHWRYPNPPSSNLYFSQLFSTSLFDIFFVFRIVFSSYKKYRVNKKNSKKKSIHKIKLPCDHSEKENHEMTKNFLLWFLQPFTWDRNSAFDKKPIDLCKHLKSPLYSLNLNAYKVYIGCSIPQYTWQFWHKLIGVTKASSNWNTLTKSLSLWQPRSRLSSKAKREGGEGLWEDVRKANGIRWEVNHFPYKTFFQNASR